MEEEIKFVPMREQGPVPICLFNHAPKGEPAALAVGLFHLPEGCYALDNTEQPLCAQHVVSAAPTKGIKLVEVYNRHALIQTGWLAPAAIDHLSKTEP